MADSHTETELILRGIILGKHFELVGTLNNGKLDKLSGCVQLNQTLASLENDLNREQPFARILQEILGTGDIVLDTIAAGYCKAKEPLSQIGLMLTIGGSTCQLAMLKGLGDSGGFIVGVDLRSSSLTLKNNFLSGLIGDVSIGNLGIYYANKNFEEVPFYTNDDFRDASILALPQKTEDDKLRRFPEGLRFSAEILIGGINILKELENSYQNLVKSTGSNGKVSEETKDPDQEFNKAQAAFQADNPKSPNWIEVNKSLGPVTIRRVSFGYDKPRIRVNLDAKLQLSVLTLTLEGLGVSYPLDKFTTKPKQIWDNLNFHLDGASLMFSQGPITISGGLIRTHSTPDFRDEEFIGDYKIDNLVSSINQLKYEVKAIEEINKLLTNKDLFENIIKKKKIKKPSPRLIKYMKDVWPDFRAEGFNEEHPAENLTSLSRIDPGTIKRINRVALEDAFPTKIPKNPLIDDPLQLAGTLLIQTTVFTISAIGSYTTLDGKPSLFIFAALQRELGGPPFFFVTGLAVGFGIHRTLTLPSINDVHNYPLIKAATDSKYLGENLDLRKISNELDKYIHPSPGNYWLAAGVKFSTFGMIESFALLSVSFGMQFEIALLGIAKMTIPKDFGQGLVIAYVELVLKAVISPAEGTVAVEGRLTSESYIFSRDCHLTGGFAFFLWFSGEHAGDFVITLGGYHPKFKRPVHYPVVPRLGVNWQVTKQLTITSEFYFAVTPSCLMAGGKLSAVYQSGSIRAWFIAYADFLLNWKPLYYMAEMGISIGVEVSLRISLGFCKIAFAIAVHLNVQLHIWGPPFAGLIKVDLSVITFTIRFGEAKTPPPALTAAQFVDSFLPKQKEKQVEKVAAITTQINSGLIREEKQKEGEEDGVIRVVNAHALALTIQSLIPITEFPGLTRDPEDHSIRFKSNIPDTASTKEKPFDLPVICSDPGIRSMGKTTLTSSCNVCICKNNKGDITGKQQNVRIALVTAKVPDALWGKSIKGKEVPDSPEANLLSVCVGLRISFDPIDPQGALPAMEIEKFKYENCDEKLIPWDKSAPSDEDHTYDLITIANVMDKDTIIRRNKVLDVFGVQNWPFTLNKVDLTEMKNAGNSYFQAGPEYCDLGKACV